MERWDIPKCIRATGENACFAASNSAKGFHSYYKELFDSGSIQRLYAIKGGPGTGKSHFMREVAKAGMANGWAAEMVYCSSDADSLDGVILTKGGEGIALLDATAPHVYEPSRPGFREEIVNLGEFWDSERLRERKEDIEDLNRQKGEAYRRAYRYLSAYGEMRENRRELVRPYLNERGIVRFAERLMQPIPNGKGFESRAALISSIGMRGAVGLDTHFANAEQIILLEDCRGSAERLMEELYRVAARKGLCVRVSKDPILSDAVDGLFLTESRTLFATLPASLCAYPHRTVSMRRFVNTMGLRAVRASVNFTEAMERAMLNGAIEEMERVKTAHFLLEQIYTATMDFSAKEAYTKAFCKQLFSLQKGEKCDRIEGKEEEKDG